MKNGGKKPCRQHGERAPGLFSLLFLCAFFLLAAHPLFAHDAQDEVFARRAQTAFDQAQIRFQSQTNNPVAAWDFARTCFDLADCATNQSERAAVAREGMAACRRSLALTNSAAAHYYLALNLGQLASSEPLRALKLVHEMERELKAAAELDPHFDFAGPERSLALLYRDAPGWPMSIGNRHEARVYLERAAALAPDYPGNVLNLGESYLKWGNRAVAKKELDALDALWPQAQKNLTGPAWEDDWDDWSKRRDILRQKLN